MTIQKPVPTRAVNEALAYLATQHNTVASYNDIESLVVDGEGDLSDHTYRGITHHLFTIRRELQRILWQKEIYVGISLLDDLIYHHVRNDPRDAYGNTYQTLLQNGADHSGFVLYPLHGFGLSERFSLWSPLPREYICFNQLGIAFLAQSHSIESAYLKLSKVTHRLGISGKVPFERFCSFDYNLMKWLTRNPVMVVKIASHTGDYFENQYVYILKIKVATAFTMMLHALAIDRLNRKPDLLMSTRSNNFETLDIRHYLIAEASWSASEELRLLRIPMGRRPIELAKLADLTITLHSKALRLPFVKAMTPKLLRATREIELGYVTHVNGHSDDKLRRFLFARIVTALDWFRQSFGSRATSDESTVALAIAFETLLTDFYAGGVVERVVRRVRICLRRRHGVDQYAEAVRSVLKSRGAVVHTGSTQNDAHHLKAQAAFALCFHALVDRLPNLSTSRDQPIGKLLGD